MSNEREINSVLQEGIVRYSQVWEDYELLSEGLKIQSDDHILSIASAGCNALAMLLEEPASVTAVDLNPSQTAICHLKKAGYTHLSHAEFVSLMGVRKEHSISTVRPNITVSSTHSRPGFAAASFILLLCAKALNFQKPVPAEFIAMTYTLACASARRMIRCAFGLTGEFIIVQIGNLFERCWSRLLTHFFS